MPMNLPFQSDAGIHTSNLIAESGDGVMVPATRQNAGKSAAAKFSPFIISFIAEIVMAAALSGIMVHAGFTTARQGAITGALVWLGFVLTTIVVNNAYTFRSLKLTAIDAGHWLGVLVIIGAIVGWMGV